MGSVKVAENVRFRTVPELAPETGLEPVTRRLTAGCSTIELLWNPSSSPTANPQYQELAIEVLWNMKFQWTRNLLGLGFSVKPKF